MGSHLNNYQQNQELELKNYFIVSGTAIGSSIAAEFQRGNRRVIEENIIIFEGGVEDFLERTIGKVGSIEQELRRVS